MNKFFKNTALLIVGSGFLLLPLAFYITHKRLTIVASALCIVGGYVIAIYYDKRDVHAHGLTWWIGLPSLALIFAIVLRQLSLPLLIVPIGTGAFVLHIFVLQLLFGKKTGSN